MLKKLGIGATLISVIFILTACAGSMPAAITEPTPSPSPEPAPAPDLEPTPAVDPEPRPSGSIKATWVEVNVDPGNRTVSIPLAELEDNWNTHFRLETTDGDIDFMAYILEGAVYIRANVCPPCRSVGFSLDEDNRILICDRCATIFDAETGSGIEGACVDYPKAAIAYEIVDGQIVASETELITAYEETLLPG